MYMIKIAGFSDRGCNEVRKRLKKSRKKSRYSRERKKGITGNNKYGDFKLLKCNSEGQNRTS